MRRPNFFLHPVKWIEAIRTIETPFDREYLVRCERLKSELGQPRDGIDSGRLKALRDELEDLIKLDAGRPSEAHVAAVVKIDAELCIYKHKDLLYPTYLRLVGKLYRFKEPRRSAWESDLKRLIADQKKEDTLRQRLRQLTFEASEDAESYNRIAAERADVYWSLLWTGVLFLIVALLAIVPAILLFKGEGPKFVHWLVPSVLAGAIGAITTTLIGIYDEEKPRPEYKGTLQLQVFVRGVLGIVYAAVVYVAVWCRVLPIALPTEKDPDIQFAFYLALGFAAGFSDKLFGKTISKFIVEGSAAADKEKKKRKDDNKEKDPGKDKDDGKDDHKEKGKNGGDDKDNDTGKEDEKEKGRGKDKDKDRESA